MKRTYLRLLPLFLALICVLWLLPGQADTVKDETNTALGVGRLHNPVMENPNPAEISAGYRYHGGGWAYVYYGLYDGSPVRYRVLDKASYDFGVSGGSLLLDCDTVLFKALFDNDNRPNSGTDHTSDWAYSDIRSLLNGSGFLTKAGVFTAVERAAIAPSYKSSRASGDTVGHNRLPFVPLNGDRIFLLDSGEVCRASYGYVQAKKGRAVSEYSYGRAKNGDWLLRSPYYYNGDYRFYVNENDPSSVITDDNGNYLHFVGYIMRAKEGEDFYGVFGYAGPNDPYGVSPVFNVSLSNILFSTLTSWANDEYKLTLLDGGLSVSIPEGQQITRRQNLVSIPYTVTGDVNRLSLLVKTGGGSIRYYRPMEVEGAIGSSGVASCPLPSSIAAGDRFYIVAEKINGDHYTDYAGEPLEITVPENTDVLFAVVTEGQQISRQGDTLIIPYTVTGSANRLSLRVTASNGRQKASVTLDVQGEVGASGVASCVLPAGLLTSDRAYLVAEYVYGVEGSDYAGTPTEITVPRCTVTWDANGGAVSPGAMQTDWYGRLSLPELPAPSREGCYCVGWFTAPEGGEEVTLNTVLGTVYEDSGTVYYAHWASANAVSYIDAQGGAHSCGGAKPVRSTDTVWNAAWYAVTEDTTLSSRVSVSGTVNLILCDGAELTAPQGIRVAPGTTLIVWQQAGGTGALTASYPGSKDDNAGIGGNKYESCGTVVINGGAVTATASDGAGIGGGYYGAGGSVTINGGAVTATASDGAGIGGGCHGAAGVIIINGGTVTATADTGAGIGGGKSDAGGAITINGGAVSATANTGAGIGGGRHGAAGAITINGGAVIATSTYSAGIGGGGSSTHTEGGDGGAVVIRGGQVTASGAISIGPGGSGDKQGEKGTVTFSWSVPSDFIQIKSVIAGQYTLERPMNYGKNGKIYDEVTVPYLARSEKNTKIIRLIPGLDDAGVSIQQGDQSLIAGDTLALTAEVADPGTGTGAWTWTSDAPAVAQVDENGLVTAVGEGTARITAVYISDDTGGEAAVTLTVSAPHAVTADVVNGSAAAEPAEALAGTEITLTFTPEGSYTVLETLTVMCGGQPVPFTRTGDYTCAFTMPDAAVQVNAAFREPDIFAVRFANQDGSTLQIDFCQEGTLPAYISETPVLASDARYDYAFAGWDREIVPADADAVYLATYTPTERTYAIFFLNWDGAELQTAALAYAALPAYTGDIPFRPAEGATAYAFTGWTPDIAPVAGEAVYTAAFEALPALHLGENTLTLTKQETAEYLFIPDSDSYYRFHTLSAPDYSSVVLYDGEERIASGTRFDHGNIECASELTAGKVYHVAVDSPVSDGQMALVVEPAGVYHITVVNDDPNGEMVIYTGIDTAYAGQFVEFGYYPADETYQFYRLIVTDTDGNAIDLPEGFYMPACDVKVHPVFRQKLPIAVQMDEHAMMIPSVNGRMWDVEGLMALPDAYVEMYLACDMDEYHIASVTVTGADGTMIPCSSFRDPYGGDGVYYWFWMPDMAVTVDVRCWIYPEFDLPDLLLPSSLTRIEAEAFEGGAMTVVDIPRACARIGDHAFRNCRGLSQIRIPRTCTLGEGVFDGCPQVFVFGITGSSAEIYCETHDNCTFVPLDRAGD